MSYSITINGHRDFDTTEEREAFEARVIEAGRRFAAELEGVNSASASTAGAGYVDLLAAS